MDGLEKSLAEMKALSAPTADRLRDQHSDLTKPAPQISAADQTEKTLAGKVIGGVWDLAAGTAETAQGRAERAQKADGYAEIAADTFACIPRFKAITGGIARSVLLIDVSGQSSTGDVLKGMALNFAQGAALNGVTKMASTESAVGRMVTSRLGTGLGGELTTHAIAGGGFGLVKSGMSEHSWRDEKGDFSFANGMRNIAVGTTTGAFIGMPAGMAGQRFGRIVTLGLGNGTENATVSAAVQKFATGAGSGFASGSVFGGVDAVKSGKSLDQVWHSTLEGGVVGFLTGGVSSGFDRSPHANLRVSNQELIAPRPMEERLATQRLESDGGTARQLSITERIVERSDRLLSQEGVSAAFDKLTFRPPDATDITAFTSRLKPPVLEIRSRAVLKDNAPKTHEEYVEALKKIKSDDQEIDYHDHFYSLFTQRSTAPHRVYEVEGHTTKIVVPEAYAKQLDEVREMRIQNSQPSAYDRLNLTEKAIVARAMKEGDATPLRAFMTEPEITQYLKVYTAGQELLAHPMAYRTLPEDLVPVIDALPHRGLIKEINLLDSRHIGDVYKAVVYEAPTFQAAATVGEDKIVNLYQSKRFSSLFGNVFHEWSHLAKWASPQMSKVFDLASVVDHVDLNTDHHATEKAREIDPSHETIKAAGQYYPNRHASRSQDENYAVGLGDNILAPDLTDMLIYVGHAPVRSLAFSASLEQMITTGKAHANASTMEGNFAERAQYLSEAAQSSALGTLQRQMEFGSPVQKAAAAQLMAHFGTVEQAPELLAMASDKNNNVVPEWKGSLAENAMEGNTLTVAQHAFDSYLQLTTKAPSQRFEKAMELLLNDPQSRDAAVDYIARSTDHRAEIYSGLAKAYNPNGSPVERAAGVVLLKKFGGPESADLLLKTALQNGNDVIPNFREAGFDSRFGGGRKTVAQLAYEGFIDASRASNVERYKFAYEQGMSHGKQRTMAADYLISHWDVAAQGYGKFLANYDKPGHVSQLQEILSTNFSGNPQMQKTIFEQMMTLTGQDSRRHLELIEENLLHTPSLRRTALLRAEAVLTRGTTPIERRAISDMLTERLKQKDVVPGEEGTIKKLLRHVEAENKLQGAITAMTQGRGDRVNAVHDVSAIHDKRAIKPLLQQAVSGGDAVKMEAIAALRQYNPTLIKFYANELRREYFSNPLMTGKITTLLGSGELSPKPRNAQAGL